MSRVLSKPKAEAAGASARVPVPAPSRASWQEIYDALREAVMRHRLDPGAKIVEEELAELFGVSRTIVRAALQALGRDGIVVIERNKGARLARPSPREAREIFEARELIEPRLALLAAARLSPGDVERLGAAIEAEHRALHADNLGEGLFQSAEFHRVIAAASGQAVLTTMLGDLLSRSSLVLALYWRRPEAFCENEAHHALVEALAGGDGERAARLMQQHIAALLAGLDLTERPLRRSSIAEALSRADDGL
ncbi:GntR family transcriptional regulator [Aureimonas endophytica]|nr:GntR family transcriptional regulator [Aureimonas endophytica]